MAAGGKRQGAGRKKGSKNKKTIEAMELLDSMECDPIMGMALIAMGDVDCKVCAEDGQVTMVQFFRACGLAIPSKWRDEETDVGSESVKTVECPVCGGTKRHPVDVKLRADMFKELAQYVAPKLKSMELSTNPENPIVHAHFGVNLDEQEAKQVYAKFMQGDEE